MADIKLIVTSDGSHSLLNTALDETYHSRHGALRESQYVFIQHGLDFFRQQNPGKSISILEVGFGTGLNSLLTFQYAKQHGVTIHYTSLETFPLSEEIWSTLNYAQSESDKHAFQQLHQVQWNQAVSLTENFSLHKKEQSLQQFVATSVFDIIYFDAFAPNKQPELWEVQALQKTTDALQLNGIFVTYCAKGQLKRDLKSLGLQVESLPGPPGKREMVRAIKSANAS